VPFDGSDSAGVQTVLGDGLAGLRVRDRVVERHGAIQLIRRAIGTTGDEQVPPIGNSLPREWSVADRIGSVREVEGALAHDFRRGRLHSQGRREGSRSNKDTEASQSLSSDHDGHQVPRACGQLVYRYLPSVVAPTGISAVTRNAEPPRPTRGLPSRTRWQTRYLANRAGFVLGPSV